MDTRKEERVSVNVSLTQDEKAKLKIYAVKKGKTVSAVIQEFIASLENDDTEKRGDKNGIY